VLDFWINETQSRCSRRSRKSSNPLIHQSIFHGMSTGQARRASVLTSACLRASGASPRHSATLVDSG
jgi:hypothetical protein